MAVKLLTSGWALTDNPVSSPATIAAARSKQEKSGIADNDGTRDMANNVVRFPKKFDPPTPTEDESREIYLKWIESVKENYEQKLQELVDKGWITSGHVEVTELGIPMVYVTPNTDFYNQTLTVGFSNT